MNNPTDAGLVDSSTVARWGIWYKRLNCWVLVPIPTHQGLDHVMCAIACESRDEVEDIIEALRDEGSEYYDIEELEARELVYVSRPHDNVGMISTVEDEEEGRIMKLRYLVEVEVDEQQYNSEHVAGTAGQLFGDEIKSNLESVPVSDGITDVLVTDISATSLVSDTHATEQLRAVMNRLDRWRLAESGSPEEEPFIDMVCSITDEIARLFGVRYEDRGLKS